MLELQKQMDKGKLTSSELVLRSLERMEKLDGRLRAILAVNPEAAEIAAALDEERLKSGPRSLMHGVPVIIKDSVATKDKMPTTGGTVPLESFFSSKDSFLVGKLRQAGAVILAKSNLHELSYGYATLSTLGGQTLNPYATDRQPGGSSGGTAVAVATEMGVAGIGEDTAGSIRVPAAFNSLVGIRPTVGLVSRTGLIPISPSRDTAGPITRTVSDAAIMLDAIAGYDPEDSITASCVKKIPESYTAFLKPDGLQGARIGVVRELFGDDSDGSAAVNQVINAAIEKMKTLGAEVVDPVEVPRLTEIVDREKYVFEGQAEWQPAFNEFLGWAGDSAPIKSFRELAESGKVGAHVIKMVTDALGAAPPQEDIDYLKTLTFAQRLAETGIHQVMAEHNLDALVYPAVKEPPALIGETQTGAIATGLGARARFPSIVVPAGFTDDGFPVGIELLARAYEEPRLIELGYSFEQGTQYRKPPEVD